MLQIPPARLYKILGQPFEFHTGSCQQKMFSIFLLAAVICLTAGKPFPDPQNDVENFDIASSGTVGWDTFVPNLTDEQNSGADQILSQPSSLGDSIFANGMPGSAGTDTLNVGSATGFAISGEGSNIDLFGQTPNLDEGLPADLVDENLFGESSDVGVNSPFSAELAETDLASDSCPYEADQPYGKRKRAEKCAPPKSNPSLEEDKEPLLGSNNLLENKSPQLDDKPGPLPGYDQPGIPQTKLCSLAFTPVCCFGSEDLGLTQTGCDECMFL